MPKVEVKQEKMKKAGRPLGSVKNEKLKLKKI